MRQSEIAFWSRVPAFRHRQSYWSEINGICLVTEHMSNDIQQICRWEMSTKNAPQKKSRGVLNATFINNDVFSRGLGESWDFV